MYDAASVIWYGKKYLSKTPDTNAKAEKRQKSLNKATAKLMKNYPPPK